MSGPWEDYAAPQAEAGPWSDYSAPAATEPPKRSTAQELIRQLKLTGRIGAEAVGALPLAAMDAGVGVRNAITGSNYELPSSMYSSALDQVFAPRETFGEKAVGVLGNILLGSKLPVPGIKEPAPSGYSPAIDPTSQSFNPRLSAFAKGRSAGYVAPPTTVAASMGNKTAEGLAGKLTTAQLASAKNQSITNAVNQADIGLSPNAPATVDAIKEVRSGAMKAYDAIRGAGEMSLDDQFRAALDKIEATSAGAERSFAGLAKNPAADEFAVLRDTKTFDAGDGVDAIRVLRDKADEAFRQGSGRAGNAYKQMAKAIENAIERNLKDRGADAASMLAKYREARTLLAKTYTAEKVLNPQTGNFDATKLARELNKGVPLTGGQKQAAEFAQAFPKAARDFNESLPGISPLDFYASGGITAGSGNPLYLGLPFARLATRNALLSNAWQNSLIPRPYVPPEKTAAALATGINRIGQR